MARRTVDNDELERWRGLHAVVLVERLSTYAKQDPSYQPRLRQATTRWHCDVDGAEFELLCCGPKFYDCRAKRGGGGAIDLVMHLKRLQFAGAVSLLRTSGL